MSEQCTYMLIPSLRNVHIMYIPCTYVHHDIIHLQKCIMIYMGLHVTVYDFRVKYCSTYHVCQLLY